ncbi:toxin [Actinomycetes bacterium KLBMP 9759]
MDLGTSVEFDGGPAVRFECTYSQPPDRVRWATAEPGGRAHWFPASVSIAARVGDPIEFTDPNVDPTSGNVLAFEPPRRLADTGGGDELHFRLEPTEAGGSALMFVDVLEARAAARKLAGWTVCLSELDDHISGVAADGPHSVAAEPWGPVDDSDAPAGASIPGR